MSNNVIQTAFAGGELSPTLFARVDINKYKIGAARMRNWFVDYRGGASTRPGTKFIALSYGSYFTKDPTKAIRLIPFQFSVVQTYMLEFGDFYMRVFADGAPVLEPSVTISGISQASSGVVTTASAHGYANNDTVYFADIAGMTQLNQVTAVISNATSTTFQLRDIITGAYISTLSYDAYTSGGTVARVYTLVTPWAAADLALLKYTQSADVMTLVHTSYAPYDLSRTSSYAWTVTAVSFATNISAPTGQAAATSSAGNAVYSYVVTAVGSDGQESVASSAAGVSAAVNIAVTAGFNTVSWSAVTGAASYNIYKASPLPVAGTIPSGVSYGYVGNVTGLSWTDNNITPDFSLTPPAATNPFASSNYPGAVAFFQQRKVYAGSTSLPETVWMSQPGAFKNFDVSNPVRADDAITATLASRQVNNIKYMIDMPGGLITLTGGSAWQINGGGNNDPVTPTSIVAQAQSYNGTADVEPIPINDQILYVQATGTIIRALSYNFYTNIYVGADISVLSNHFFSGYSILTWAYAEEPFKLVWAVRSDGHLLTLTYLKEQEIYGWAEHDTYGLFTSTASIREDTLNAVYFAVKRKLGSNDYLQYIERLAERSFPYGVEDAWCLDCALQNELTYPDAILTASETSGSVTFEADAAVFDSGDVGSVIRVGGGIATITAYTDSMHVVGTTTRDISTVIDLNGTASPAPADSGDWSLTAPITEISGLEHLEGQSVVALGDGNVFEDLTVEDGAITLSQACSKVIVGLPFQAQLKSLRLDTGDPSIQGKRKKISAVDVIWNDSRGIKIGSTFDTVKEIKQRTTQLMGLPVPLASDVRHQIMDNSWNVDGQVCIQQDYPLPATILGIVPEVTVGDTDKGVK